jgi:hypothetical protein
MAAPISWPLLAVEAVRILEPFEPSAGTDHMTLTIAQYDDDAAFYVVNKADYDPALNALDYDAPDIMKELRRETIDIILRNARKAGEQVVKVSMGTKPAATKVKGYATFLRFIKGSGLPDLEGRLGFKPGALQTGGAYVYHIDALALNASNIAPRGNSDWSAGVTPRDLHNLSQQTGKKVEYHRDYPPAAQPIIQFAILEPVPILGPPRFVRKGELV